MMISPMFE